MALRNLPILIGAMAMLSSPVVHADTSVWKVSKNNHHLYLGGTVHLLSKADYPLPTAFANAYQLAHRLVLETNLQKLKNPEFQSVMLSQLTYTDGRTLKDILSNETYTKLAQYCASRKISIANIHKFKAGMAASILLFIELDRLGIAEDGVDQFFNLKAIEDQKPLGQLESVEEQISFIAAMGQGQEDEMIDYTLRDIKDLPQVMQSIKQNWRAGDMKGLEKTAIEPFITEFPATFDALLTVRNANWLPKIEALMVTAEVEFILVGALHLAGEQGLLTLLRQRGYTLEQQ